MYCGIVVLHDHSHYDVADERKAPKVKVPKVKVPEPVRHTVMHYLVAITTTYYIHIVVLVDIATTFYIYI